MLSTKNKKRKDMTLDRKRCGVKKLCVVRACQRRELAHMHASALLKKSGKIWVLINVIVYLRLANPFDTLTEVKFRLKDFKPLGNSVFEAILDVREVNLLRETQCHFTE